MAAGSDEDAIARIHAAIADAAAALTAADARREALAELIPARRSFLIHREPVLRRIGAVWRLGVFLLEPDGALRATGTLIRATPPGRPQNLSRSVEDRRSLRAAARRGGFRDGETVNFDSPRIPLDAALLHDADGPLFLRDGEALVRWSPAAGDAGARPFAGYLSERVDLLAHPPEGA